MNVELPDTFSKELREMLENLLQTDLCANMLFGLLLGAFGFINTRSIESEVIDDVPFRLHYVFTSGFLFFSTALVGLSDVVGFSIQCFGGDNQNGKAKSRFCWLNGTKPIISRDTSESLSYHGGACYWSGNDLISQTSNQSCIPVQAYFQWIPLLLFIMAVLFYAPKKFWDLMEEGKMKAFTEGVKAGENSNRFLGTAFTLRFLTQLIAASNAIVLGSGAEKLSNVAKNVANYFNMPQAGHFKYGACFLLSQIFNILVVLFSFYLTNRTLDGNFSMLGPRWVYSEMRESSGDSVLQFVFPRKSSCQFSKFGSGGGRENEELLCVMAQNIISEKIFVFLWFWFVILVTVDILNILSYVLMIFKVAFVRKVFLARAVGSRKPQKDLCKAETLNKFLTEMNFGKFLFTYLMARNVSYTVFKAILAALLSSDTPEFFMRVQEIQTSDTPNAPDLHFNMQSFSPPSYHHPEKEDSLVLDDSPTLRSRTMMAQSET